MVTKLRIRAYNSQVPLVLVNYLLQDDLYEKHGNMTKNTQSRKAHFHPTHSKREERPTTWKNRAQMRGDKDTPKPNHLIFVEHHHGPSQEAQRSSLTKNGHVWALWWCGHTTGATTPQPAHFCRRLPTNVAMTVT